MPCVEVLDISKSLEDSLYVHMVDVLSYFISGKKRITSTYVYERFHWKMHRVLILCFL